MIKTIYAHTAEDMDERVNAFEKAQSTGNVTRVFAVQTHFVPAASEGCYDAFVAVVFYREAPR